MSIIVDWGNQEETLIIWKFEGKWNAQDFHNAIEYTRDLLHSVPHCVNIIFDMQRSALSNQNLISLKRAFAIKMPANLNQVVVLSHTEYWNRIFSSINKALDEKHQFPFILYP